MKFKFKLSSVVQLNVVKRAIAAVRMWPWLVAALVAVVYVGYTQPQMVGLLIWGLCKMCFGAFLGYWFDRSIARGKRPHELEGEAKYRAELRRAHVVVGSIIAMALMP